MTALAHNPTNCCPQVETIEANCTCCIEGLVPAKIKVQLPTLEMDPFAPDFCECEGWSGQIVELDYRDGSCLGYGCAVITPGGCPPGSAVLQCFHEAGNSTLAIYVWFNSESGVCSEGNPVYINVYVEASYIYPGGPFAGLGSRTKEWRKELTDSGPIDCTTLSVSLGTGDVVATDQSANAGCRPTGDDVSVFVSY